MTYKLIFTSMIFGCAALLRTEAASAETGYFFFSCEVDGGIANRIAISSPFAFSYEAPAEDVEDTAGSDQHSQPALETIEALEAQHKSPQEISDHFSTRKTHYLTTIIPKVRVELRQAFEQKFKEAVEAQLGSSCLDGTLDGAAGAAIGVHGPTPSQEEAVEEVEYNVRAIKRIREEVRSIDTEAVKIEFDPHDDL